MCRAVTRVLGELLLFCTDVTGNTSDDKYVGHPIDITGLPVPPRQRLIVEQVRHACAAVLLVPSSHAVRAGVWTQNVVPMLIAMLTTPFTEWGGRFQLAAIREQHERLKMLQKRRSLLVSHDHVSRRGEDGLGVSGKRAIRRGDGGAAGLRPMQSPLVPIVLRDSDSDTSPSNASATAGAKAKGKRTTPQFLSRTASRRGAMGSLLNVQEPDAQLLSIYRVCKLVYVLALRVWCGPPGRAW